MKRIKKIFRVPSIGRKYSLNHEAILHSSDAEEDDDSHYSHLNHFGGSVRGLDLTNLMLEVDKAEALKHCGKNQLQRVDSTPLLRNSVNESSSKNFTDYSASDGEFLTTNVINSTCSYRQKFIANNYLESLEAETFECESSTSNENESTVDLDLKNIDDLTHLTKMSTVEFKHCGFVNSFLSDVTQMKQDSSEPHIPQHTTNNHKLLREKAPRHNLEIQGDANCNIDPSLQTSIEKSILAESIETNVTKMIQGSAEIYISPKKMDNFQLHDKISSRSWPDDQKLLPLTSFIDEEISVAEAVEADIIKMKQDAIVTHVTPQSISDIVSPSKSIFMDYCMTVQSTETPEDATNSLNKNNYISDALETYEDERLVPISLLPQSNEIHLSEMGASRCLSVEKDEPKTLETNFDETRFIFMETYPVDLAQDLIPFEVLSIEEFQSYEKDSSLDVNIKAIGRNSLFDESTCTNEPPKENIREIAPTKREISENPSIKQSRKGSSSNKDISLRSVSQHQKNSAIHSTPKKLNKCSTRTTMTPTSVKIGSNSASSIMVPRDAALKLQKNGKETPRNGKPITSKVNSLENADHKPGGGNVKIYNEKLEFQAESKCNSKDNIKHKPSGGNVKITDEKLKIDAHAKVASLENVTYKPGGGDKKIVNEKLKWDGKPKIGSLENKTHKPQGGNIKIAQQKLDFRKRAQPKVNSLENAEYTPRHREIQIFNESLPWHEMGGRPKLPINDEKPRTSFDRQKQWEYDSRVKGVGVESQGR